jgi:hypothetical protein
MPRLVTSAPDTAERGAPPIFITTRWSIVMSARENGSEQSSAALEALCRAYWYPLYAYIRRFGRSAPDAQVLIDNNLTPMQTRCAFLGK